MVIITSSNNSQEAKVTEEKSAFLGEVSELCLLWHDWDISDAVYDLYTFNGILQNMVKILGHPSIKIIHKSKGRTA